MADGQWRTIFRRQRRSGLNVAAFCAREGVAVSTFYARRRALGVKAKPASRSGRTRRSKRPGRLPGFVEVRPTARDDRVPRGVDEAGVPASHASWVDEALELTLPRGVRVRVRPGFDAALLRQVVEALT